MKLASVTIIDYGLGNLHSVANALRFLGAKVLISENPEDILKTEHLILPGVGAFGDGMHELQKRGQATAIREYAMRNAGALLGICLGAQLFLTESEEFGTHKGLGLIPGSVKALPRDNQKVPNVGWKEIHLTENGKKSFLTEGTWAYFVHSFHAKPESPAHLLATISFGNTNIAAAIGSGLITGLQFHPEKSGDAGLEILRRFLES